MNIKGLTLFLMLGLGFVRMGCCQAPPNDNFADRIVLTGNNIVLTSSLVGATVEPGEPIGWPFVDIPIPARSVWWSWTATETTPVTLVALGYSDDTLSNMGVAVYAGTNLLGNPKPVVVSGQM